MNLIAFFCVLGACLVLSCISIFGKGKNNLVFSTTSKGITGVAILGLAILTSNITGLTSGTVSFIMIGLALQLISNIFRTIPTRKNLFALSYWSMDLLSGVCFTAAALLFIELTPIAIAIGFGVGVLTSFIYALASKKLDPKIDFIKYAALAFSFSALAQTIYMLINELSYIKIAFVVGTAFFAIYSIFTAFVTSEKRSVEITRNIFYYLSLVVLAGMSFLYII